MPNPSPQVVKVKKPLILAGPVPLGILSARPFGAAGDLTPQIPAYEVPPPLLLHGPAPKPSMPLHDILGNKFPNDYLYLDRFTLLLKGAAQPAAVPPRQLVVANLRDRVEDGVIEPVLLTAALPTSPVPIGAPRSHLLVVNPWPDGAVYLSHSVFQSKIEPEGQRLPPLYYQRLFDDDYLASLAPVPSLLQRGVVPTPPPVGAPRGYLAVVIPFDVTPLIVIQPIIVHITPIGVPGPECPGHPPRVDEGCMFISRGDEGCVVYAKAEDACSRISRVDVCCN